MTPGQFREEGKKLIDRIADYYEHIEEYPVLSQVKPGEIYGMLPEDPPLRGESFDRMLEDVDRIIMPGITHWQSPRFFAYFPANASFPSILGDLLSSGLGVQGMLWATSPAATEVETRVMEWLAGMLDLPASFRISSTGGGVIQDSASSAALSALVAAREKATGFGSNTSGITSRFTAYISTQTHSSLEKAVKIAGIGRENLRLIATDGNFAMRPDLLREQIAKDRSTGYTPFFVCGTIGTTSSNGMDPLRQIGEIAREENLWMHVDAAMAGAALICPEFRHFADGLELADSFCFNPHKWMFTNFDCDCFWVTDRRHLVNTFSILPEYLRNKASESGEVFDYRDWHIPLGRRFRALKLWFVIRHYGVEGLRHHIRYHVELARDLARKIRESDHFELIMEPPLNLVCFRYKGSDEENMDLMQKINSQGTLFFTHTKLNGQVVLRLCIAQTNTSKEHADHAWEMIRRSVTR
ncbi:MAG: L-2,4-diaminobutyrate decarboxylase [Bacteroidetes bacterium ADurb.Bin123]|jgi:aromatic-L-amino-acid decarboxylase|nr:aspartate aminotransferase family protein [Bacteroidales bacterium]OQB79158.1 MAG: L-2,4-diaminobutyrate decarboxylase [Bacteroidetes bacterium ADurb.Bin123]